MRFNILTHKQFNLLFIAVILLITIMPGCERDDICIDEITPHVLIDFYDVADTASVKSVIQLTVKVLNNDSIFINGSTTSNLRLPIDVTKSQTVYELTTANNKDTLEVTYTPETIFVGRACGYKSIFKDVDYDLTQQPDSLWIKDIIPLTEHIENEDQTHVKIYH